MFKPKVKKEADASSGLGQNLRAKESMRVRLSFKESAQGQNGNVFKVVIIQEGLGNLADCSYYTREALDNAVMNRVFEGKKIYADHPTAVDEEIRPERSVRDIIGYLRNVVLDDSAGRAQVVAEACIIDNEWAKAYMTESVSFSQQFEGQDFVGLSINASGDAAPMSVDEFARSVSIPNSAMEKFNSAISMGVQTINAVKSITDVFSVDLVTEAGAGGKILALVESSKGKGKQMKKESKEMEKHESEKHESEAKHESESKHENESESKKESESEKENESEATPPETKQAKSVMDGEAESESEGDPAPEQHADAAQDMELIKKMLDQYIGEPQHDDELMNHAKEAYEACMSSGMKDKEAMETAGHAMKMAKIMAKKSSAEPSLPNPEAAHHEAEKEESESHKEGEDVGAGLKTKDGIDGKHPSNAKSGAKSMAPVKEAAAIRGEIAALKAENAKLKAEIALDKMLKESGLPVKVTKEFRESLKDVKSIEQVQKEFKTFEESYRSVQSQLAIDYDAIINPEKTEMSNGANGGFDYSSCMDE